MTEKVALCRSRIRLEATVTKLRDELCVRVKKNGKMERILICNPVWKMRSAKCTFGSRGVGGIEFKAREARLKNQKSSFEAFK